MGKRARMISSTPEAMEMYCEMQQIVTDEYGTIIPGFRNYVDAKSTKVHGMPRVPLAALGGCEWPEFAWLES